MLLLWLLVIIIYILTIMLSHLDFLFCDYYYYFILNLTC